jgi:uncharacterized membrane protein
MSRRWVKWLLIASLAFNALIIGAAASAFWRGRTLAGVHVLSGSGNLLNYVGSLPHERRRQVFGRMQPLRAEIQALRRSIREARQELFQTLTAEPFDKQRYVEAQGHLSEAEMKLRSSVQPLYAEIAASLSPQERRAFLRWRGERRGGGGAGWLFGNDDGGPERPKR